MKKRAPTIYDRVKDFIHVNGLITPGDRVLLSLSAGKDSMALLDIMERLKENLGIVVGIFHLNHLTRGSESDEDEQFVSALAEKKGMEYHKAHFNFTSRPAKSSFEEYARMVRYSCLESLAADHNYNRIATAHTRSDNAETVFMRIFTGTGVAGLRGIEAVRGRIIRPLLFLSSDEIYRHLRDSGIAWREDQSNKDTGFVRNFVRGEVLPVLYSRFPAGEDALENLSETADEYHTLLKKLLGEKYGSLYEKTGRGVIIRYRRFAGDDAIIKFAVASAIRECFNEFVSRGMLGEITRKIHVNRANLDLYSGGTLCIKKMLLDGEGVIYLAGQSDHDRPHTGPWSYRVDVRTGGEHLVNIAEIGQTLRIAACEYRFFSENRLRPDILFLALPDGIEYIVIRNRQNGDRIRLDCGVKKIKEVMIENKLDNKMKDTIPLIDVGSRVGGILFGLFSARYNRVAADLLVTQNTKTILAISGVESSLDRGMR